MPDYLRDLPVEQVAAWYGRLADGWASRRIGGEIPYAAMFLRTWLTNRKADATYRFRPRRYLQEASQMKAALAYQRSVFLSEEPARIGRSGLLGSTTRLGGVIPRIRGDAGFTRWDLRGDLQLDYESLVEIGSGYLDVRRIQQKGTSQERDLFGSLRGFQLHSRAILAGRRNSGGQVAITFRNWVCEAKDRYDWNYSEYLTVPNPDFGRRISGSVQPDDKLLTVYHSNAKRLEDAGLAAPYNVRSHAWAVTDRTITAPAIVAA